MTNDELVKKISSMSAEQLLEEVLGDPRLIYDPYSPELDTAIRNRAYLLKRQPSRTQIAAAFGKYLTGHRPGEDSWSEEDKQAHYYCMYGGK